MKKTIQFLTVLVFIASSFNAFSIDIKRGDNKSENKFKDSYFSKYNEWQKHKSHPKPVAAIFKLDSIIDQGYSKVSISYDTITGITTEISYYLDWFNNQWEPNDKSEYTTHPNGNFIELIIYYYWNNVWEATSKQNFVYDAFDNPIEVIEYYFDPILLQWIENTKTEITYDGSGNILLVMTYYWDLSSWNTMYKREYNYNINLDIIDIMSYYWDDVNNIWIYSEKTDFEYNTNEQLIKKSSFWWDEINSIWENGELFNYEYDANGFVSVETQAYWWNMQWNYSVKYEYMNNASGQETQKATLYYDDILNQWDYSSKENYMYDNQGNKIESIFYFWNYNSWDASDKTEYVYNLNFSFNDLLVPHWYDEDFGDKNMITIIKYFYWDSSQWLLADNTDFYYSTVIVDVPEAKKNIEISVYPNPASDFITIQTSGLSHKCVLDIYDILGKKVYTQDFTGSTTATLNQLNPGMYLYTITSGNVKRNGKIIKE